ncbi:DEAD/DEAH box helicase [Lacticaseibacillus suibinensis]|uniref:DEAD/DEAH box helicase n=1 Tax=Lacticaseibacillus suibinensis TaxID=2486011 RepID=UPI000F797474|nr:DEAD/DEAH box helicase [Lacticaseibacillus suibinensis]
MAIASIFQPLWQAAGFTEETPIQTAVYQPLKQDQSVVGLAPTGSGKTLAFGLPLLEKLVPDDGLQLLILAPSQELAIQTRDVLRPYAKAAGLNLQGVTGSANVKRQLEVLKQHPEVIVATAGRLLELVDSRRVSLARLQTLVIDEADEMLREPGLSQVRELAQAAPADVQLGFFSATDSPMFQELAKWFGQAVERVDVRAIDHTQGAVTHYFVQTDNAHREVWLRHLAHLDKFQALVFFNQNAVMMKVARTLSHQSVKFAVLNRTDRATTRANALNAFRKGKVTLLLVTDLAGRGLDIPHLPAVINYQTPTRPEAYIHRSGRTGRMGAAGMVITLGDDHDLRDLRRLVPQYQIVRGYLNDGKMSTEAPVEQAKPARPAKLVSPAQPNTPAAQRHAHATGETAAPAPKKAHKKNRLRDRKNKGKRKAK